MKRLLGHLYIYGVGTSFLVAADHHLGIGGSLLGALFSWSYIISLLMKGW